MKAFDLLTKIALRIAFNFTLYPYRSILTSKPLTFFGVDTTVRWEFITGRKIYTDTGNESGLLMTF